MAAIFKSAIAQYIWPVEIIRHVAQPPVKPLMVFDGDCGFCRRWITRWKRRTGDSVDYLAAQDERVRSWFPEIAAEQFAEAVHLISNDGVVYRGAEAVLRSLHSAQRATGWLLWYERYPWFAQLMEAAYRWVARNRRFLSRLL